MSVERALAWRLGRQYLLGGADSAADVVRRLSAVPAWSGDADLAIRRRLKHPSADAVEAAVRSGELIKLYAFRGATHLLAAGDAGAFMAVRAASAQWNRPSWQQYYDLQPSDWPALRQAARDVVRDHPVSHGELVDALTRSARFHHLRQALLSPSHTLLKPLAWQGDICLGPSTDGRPTFQSPEASPYWEGLPDVDEAGRRVVLLYLSAYGPATIDHLRYWLVAGLSAGRRRLDGWLARLLDEGDAVVDVQLGGTPAFHLGEQLDALAGTELRPDEVTLLPGHDQWVLGPGTADERLVPAAHRSAITRGANLLLQAGRVAGTWTLDHEHLVARWFPDHQRPATARLEEEAARLSALLGRHSDVTGARANRAKVQQPRFPGEVTAG